MNFPPLINQKKYLIPNSNGQIDKIQLLKDVWELFKEDFIDNEVIFGGERVLTESKILDCSVCDNNCINVFCTCDNCPWVGKLDIYQHITSDEDKSMENRLTLNAQRILRNKRRKNPDAIIRTPGKFSKSRTLRIPWIKYFIENCNHPELQIDIKRYSPIKEKIKIYHKKQDYLIIFSRNTYKNGNKELFLNSAYHKPFKHYLREFDH